MNPVDHSTTNSPGINGNQTEPASGLAARCLAIAVINRANGSAANLAAPPAAAKCAARRPAMRLASTGRHALTIRPAMFRRRLALLALLTLALLLGLYAVAWFHGAGLVRGALQDWAE